MLEPGLWSGRRYSRRSRERRDISMPAEEMGWKAVKISDTGGETVIAQGIGRGMCRRAVGEDKKNNTKRKRRTRYRIVRTTEVAEV